MKLLLPFCFLTTLLVLPDLTNCEGQRITDAELQRISEALLSADSNNVANLVRVNLQGKTSYRSKQDRAPAPLLQVNTAAYRKSTISKLLPLHNNYVANIGTKEVTTSQETEEERNFLDAAMATTVMKKTERFLKDKGYLSRRAGLRNSALRNVLHDIWFTFYPRTGRTLGSSGFEHVFLGEINNEGVVTGFHNWVFFSKEEQNRNLNYKGQIGRVVNLGNKGKIIKHKFDWNSKEKPISSMFVGTSPEFEMAIYTICFYARPGKSCPIKLNGKNVNIKTHYMNYKRKRYVGSAFPDI